MLACFAYVYEKAMAMISAKLKKKINPMSLKNKSVIFFLSAIMYIICWFVEKPHTRAAQCGIGDGLGTIP